MQFVDADAFLTEKQSLKILIEKKLPIVSPMLLSDGLYSNFWYGIDRLNFSSYYKKQNFCSGVACHQNFIINGLMSIRKFIIS